MGMEHKLNLEGPLKQKLARAQAESLQITVEGEAGGGLVRVRLNGRHHVVGVSIDPSLAEPQHIEQLQQFIRAAANEANEKLGHALQARMASLAHDMGLREPGVQPSVAVAAPNDKER